MEKINHPEHYNIPGKKECIEMMREEFGDRNTAVFCLMNSYKYLYRAGSKPNESTTDDINKALWYYDYAYNKLFPSLMGNKLMKLYQTVEPMLRAERRKLDGEE